MDQSCQVGRCLVLLEDLWALAQNLCFDSLKVFSNALLMELKDVIYAKVYLICLQPFYLEVFVLLNFEAHADELLLGTQLCCINFAVLNSIKRNYVSEMNASSVTHKCSR